MARTPSDRSRDRRSARMWESAEQLLEALEPRKLLSATFQETMSYESPDYRALTVVDIDNDGIDDVIGVANEDGAGFVFIDKGRADGGFDSSSIRLNSPSPQALTTGDINGDGRTDVVIVTAGSKTVSYLLNDGAGGLFDPVDISITNAEHIDELALGDLDGRNGLDLAVVDRDANAIWTLLNNGTNGGFNGFGAPARYDLAGTTPQHVVLADFNGDGTTDAAVTLSGSSQLSILNGIGDGEFGDRTDFGVSSPSELSIADFNDDGLADLAVGGSSLELFLNTTTADTDGFAFENLELDHGDSPRWVTVADLNSDGHDDVAVASNAESVQVIWGNGTGEGLVVTEYEQYENIRRLGAGDVNGDGTIDLISGQSEFITVIPNLGNAAFTGLHAAKTSSSSGRRVETGDLNRDGHADAVVVHSNSQVWTLLLSNGAQFVTRYDFSSDVSNPDLLELADLNGDGLLDIVISGSSSSVVSSFVNRSTPDSIRFEDENVYRLPDSQRVRSLDAGRFDRDNNADLAIATRGDRILTALGNGNGTFRNGVEPERPDDSGQPWRITTGNVSGDYLDEIIVASDFDVYVFDNTNGEFEATGAIAGLHDETVRSLRVGEISGSGRPDLVIVTSQRTFIMENWTSAGGTRFERMLDELDGRLFDADDEHGGIVIGDLNGDERNDLAIQTRQGTVLKFRTDDGFSDPVLLNNDSHWIAGTDIDADGDLDLVGLTSNGAGVMFSYSDGTFLSGATLDVTETRVEFSTLTSADVNDDGLADVIMLTENRNLDEQTTLHVWLGTTDGYEEVWTFDLQRVRFYDQNTIQVVDLDGDGDLDLTVDSDSRRGTLVFMNDGTGTDFRAKVGLNAIQTNGVAPVFADLNNDGDADLIRIYNERVWIHLGIGDGRFENAISYNIDNPLESVTTGDFDGDGNLDVAIQVSRSDWMVRRGTGDGRLAEEFKLPTYTDGIDLRAVDLNGDGLDDLVQAHLHDRSSNSALAVFYNLGGFEFTEATVIDVRFSQLDIGDINGDGTPDIVTSGSAYVTVIENTGSTLRPAANMVFEADRFLNLIDADADGDLDVLHFGSEGGLLLITKMLNRVDGDANVTASDDVIPGPYNASDIANVFGAAAGELLTIVTTNDAGEIIVFRQENKNAQWTKADLAHLIDAPTVEGSVVDFVDPKNGTTYLAGVTESGIILMEDMGDGDWKVRQIPQSDATPHRAEPDHLHVTGRAGAPRRSQQRWRTDPRPPERRHDERRRLRLAHEEPLNARSGGRRQGHTDLRRLARQLRAGVERAQHRGRRRQRRHPGDLVGTGPRQVDHLEPQPVHRRPRPRRRDHRLPHQLGRHQHRRPRRAGQAERDMVGAEFRRRLGHDELHKRVRRTEPRLRRDHKLGHPVGRAQHRRHRRGHRTPHRLLVGPRVREVGSKPPRPGRRPHCHRCADQLRHRRWAVQRARRRRGRRRHQVQLATRRGLAGRSPRRHRDRVPAHLGHNTHRQDAGWSRRLRPVVALRRPLGTGQPS